MHALPLAGAAPPFFAEIALLVLAGALIGYLCQRLGLVPIVGFLLAGVVIGPYGLGLVADREIADAAAELGVVLLLFTIGIEFSLEKLARIRRLIFLGGGLQVGLATAAVAALCLALGAAWRPALFTGLLVSLSSTAIVLKLLADRGETSHRHGQVGLGLLIFQDLAIVAMVLLVPALAGAEGAGSGAEVALALGKAVALIAAVLLFARRLVPKVLEKVAETCAPEIFLLTVMALCFGTAWLTSLAGVSLSLGAFLAGLVVSESRHSEHALSEILPLQIIFSALFFLSVGMLLDLAFLVTHLPMILAAVAAVFVVKVATTGVSVAALGRGLPVAGASALMLAQVGEFSFVLERAGREVGLTPAGLGEAGSQTFIAATVLLMIATPPLTGLGVRLAARLEEAKRRRLAERFAAGPETSSDEALGRLPDLRNHVILAGYGGAARRLARVLRGSGVPFLVTTLSPGGAREAEEAGMTVLRGDASRRTILEHAGIGEAKMLVVADDDVATTRRIVAVARPLNPTLRLVARTRWLAEVDPLTEEGVDRVVVEELESIVALFDDVLVSYRVSPSEVEDHDAALRSGSYALLRATRSAPGAETAGAGPQKREAAVDGGAESEARGGLGPGTGTPRAAGTSSRPASLPDLPPDWECELGPDCLDSRTVTIRATAPAAALAWGELARHLEAEHGVRAAGLRRSGRPLPGVPAELRLQPGDEVVLEAPPDRFRSAGELFRTEATAAGERREGAREGLAASAPDPEGEPEDETEANGAPGGGDGAFGRSVGRSAVFRPSWLENLDLGAPVELHSSAGATVCSHLDQVQVVRPGTAGCEECLAEGQRWVHLRVCMTCGHVGCCDSSPGRHASAHHRATGHPVVRSFEPGEDWGWCFVDEAML